MLGRGPFTPGALASSLSAGSCSQASEVPEVSAYMSLASLPGGGLGGPVEFGIEEPL